MELRIAAQAKGFSDQAKERIKTLNLLISIAESEGFEEIILPSVEPQGVYVEKAGAEILNLMYVFEDKNSRSLCLRPEGAATVQLIADTHFKKRKNQVNADGGFVTASNNYESLSSNFTGQGFYVASMLDWTDSGLYCFSGRLLLLLLVLLFNYY